MDIVVAGGSSETEAYVNSVFIYNTAEGFWRPGKVQIESRSCFSMFFLKKI